MQVSSDQEAGKEVRGLTDKPDIRVGVQVSNIVIEVLSSPAVSIIGYGQRRRGSPTVPIV